MKHLQYLSFCKLQYFKRLMPQQFCLSGNYYKFPFVSILNDNVKKRWYHKNSMLFNNKDAASYDSSQSHISVIEDENFIKSQKHMFPTPKNALKNYYYLTKHTLKENFEYDYEFEHFGQDHNRTYICALVLNGPVHETFIGYGKNKRMAESAASVKALISLFKGNHLDTKGRPKEILKASIKPIRRDEIFNQLHEPFPLSLSEDDLLSAQQLINHYENIVSPIVQSAANESDSEDLEQYSDGNSDAEEKEEVERTMNLMTGKQLIESENTDHRRNIDLLRRLNKARVRKDYSLPIYTAKAEILEAVKNNSVTIIEGGTGCGKSTQVPQIIMEEWIDDMRGSECNIIIAQPKRIATLCIANQVALQRQEELGFCVGYKMRLDEVKLNRDGGFMFYTCGNLREILRYNPSLKGISHIIVDETHERSIDTDLLLLLVKKALKKNPTLKVILMSATSNLDELKSYFETNAVVSIPSNTLFPIQTFYLGDVLSKLKETAMNESEVNIDTRVLNVNYKFITKLIKHIHANKPEGAVLVFLPGWKDIKTLHIILKNEEEFQVLPLHSKVPSHYQNQIFEDPVKGKRKVILATNIAETSITIPDVVYVIDTGLQNDSRFDPGRNISVFGTFWISKANAIQRKGRTGRVQPGEVYRLYDEDVYNSMEEFPKPDVFKLPLENIVLKCKSFFEELSIREVLNNMINPPQSTSIEKAIELLAHLQLMKCDKGGINESLTPLGRKIAKFSTSPFFSKPLIFSSLLGCVDPALNISCVENQFDNLFKNVIGNKSLRYLKQDLDAESDLLAIAKFLQSAFDANSHLDNHSLGLVSHQDLLSAKEENEIKFDNNDSYLYEEIDGKATVCPKRLTYFLNVRSLLKNQLASLLPYGAGTSGDLSGDMGQLDEKQDSSVDPSPELILASFLSSAKFLIRLVKNEKNDNSVLVFENSKRVIATAGSVWYDQYNEYENTNYFFSSDVYHSKDTNIGVAKDLSSVSALSVALFYGEDLEIVSCEGDVDPLLTLQIKNRNVYFHMDQKTAKCVISLRKLFHDIVNYYLELPNFMHLFENEDSKVVFKFCHQYQRLLSQLLRVNGNENENGNESEKGNENEEDITGSHV